MRAHTSKTANASPAKPPSQRRGRKVVSERAIKHVRNLARLAASGTPASVLYVVNRSDCATVRACWEQDPTFANEMDEAKAKGMGVQSFAVEWTEAGECYYKGLVPYTARGK